MSQSATAEVSDRGVVTIPKKIREDSGLEAGQEVEFISLGDSAVIMVPRRLALDEARRRVRMILKRAGVSAEQVLEGLEDSRQETFEKHYPRSSKSK